MNNSNDFKKDVIKLYEKGHTATDIAYGLAKKYKVNTKDIGRGFINFKARVSMCVLRHKRSKTIHMEY